MPTKKFPTDAFFEQPVDMRNRKSMVEFLRNHKRYCVMNHWNRLYTWANDVKIQTLKLPGDVQSIAYALAYGFEHDHQAVREWDMMVNESILGFEKTYNGNYTMRFNGRNNGYIILDTANGRRITNEPGVDEISEPDFPLTDLKENVQLVIDFDKACDEIRNNLIQFCRRHELATKTVVTETHVTYLRPKDEAPD